MKHACRLPAGLGVVAVALGSGLAPGRTFPDRNITIAAPYPAGGTTDAAAPLHRPAHGRG